MSDGDLYDASHLKRIRATKSEMTTRRRVLFEIIRDEHPATIRQCYYQAAVRKLVGKTDSDYNKIQKMLTEKRRSGEVPYEWIVEGRRVRQPYTVNGILEALNDTRRQHRKDPWQTVPDIVQIWIEKNALLGVVQPLTDEYATPLMSAVGYSSISFLHKCAQQLKYYDGFPIYIYQFGDLDPSGAHAAIVIEQELRLHAPNADIHFSRIAITPEQVTEFGLEPALRETKVKDPRYRWFRETYRDKDVIKGGHLSVELDAIRPNMLRDLVRGVIEKHLPRETLDAANAEGAREQQRLARMMDEYIAAEQARSRIYLPFGSEHAGTIQLPW
jgi:hypothetical protein